MVVWYLPNLPILWSPFCDCNVTVTRVLMSRCDGGGVTVTHHCVTWAERGRANDHNVMQPACTCSRPGNTRKRNGVVNCHTTYLHMYLLHLLHLLHSYYVACGCFNRCPNVPMIGGSYQILENNIFLIVSDLYNLAGVHMLPAHLVWIIPSPLPGSWLCIVTLSRIIPHLYKQYQTTTRATTLPTLNLI